MAALLLKPETRELCKLDFAAHRISDATRDLCAATPRDVAAAIKQIAQTEAVDPLDYYAAASALGAQTPLDIAPYTLCGDVKTHRYTLWVWDNVATEKGPVPPLEEHPQGGAVESSFRQPEKDGARGFRMSGRKWVREAILVHYRKKNILRPLRPTDATAHLGFEWMDAGETLPLRTWTTAITNTPSPHLHAQLRALHSHIAPPPFPSAGSRRS